MFELYVLVSFVKKYLYIYVYIRRLTYVLLCALYIYIYIYAVYVCWRDRGPRVAVHMGELELAVSSLCSVCVSIIRCECHCEGVCVS